MASLSETAQTLGAVAAVNGSRFAADEVAALAQLPQPEVLEVLTQLYRKGLIAIEAPVGHYRFTTGHVAHALLETALPEQRLIWHERAADLHAADPIKRARHVAAITAGPEAVAAVVDAAEANVARGQHHEAVADYERAIELAQEPLAPASCIGFVRALDLSGRHDEADKVRDSAWRRAIDDGDHPTALAVLLASWPEAEAFADPDRTVARLDAIDADGLSDDEKILYTTHWSRHLSMAGREADAAAVIDRARATASSPADRIDLALAARYASSAGSTPQSCLDQLDEIRPLLSEVGAPRRADVLVHQAIDAYELGSAERLDAI
ncbi:MAG: hypothetical protein AAFO29_25140, partial [Actinomycetota bacterium]